MAFKLAELFVEFTVKGVGAFSDRLGQIKTQLAAVQQGAEAVGRAATVAFAGATAATLGWVRAGLAGTVQGEALSLRFQLLSREIAALFLPAIRQVVGSLERVIGWFRQLDGEQQRAIGRWIEGGIAAAGVAMILPKVIAGMQAATLAARGLAMSLFSLQTLGGGILGILGGLATAFAGLGVGATVALGRTGEAAQRLQPVVLRIQEAFGKLKEALASILPAAAETFASAMQAVTPVLVKVIEKVGGLFDWFNRLTPAQRENVFSWIKWAAAIGGVVAILPTAINLIQGATQALMFMIANPILAGFGALAAAIAYVTYELIKMKTASDDASKASGDHLANLTRKQFEAFPTQSRILGMTDREQQQRAAKKEIMDAAQEWTERRREWMRYQQRGLFSFEDIGSTQAGQKENDVKWAAERLERAKALYEEVAKGNRFAGASDTKGDSRAPGGREQVDLLPRGFEALQDSWRRIQMTALRSDVGTVEDQQLQQLKEIRSGVDGLQSTMAQWQPAMKRF